MRAAAKNHRSCGVFGENIEIVCRRNYNGSFAQGFNVVNLCGFYPD